MSSTVAVVCAYYDFMYDRRDCTDGEAGDVYYISSGHGTLHNRVKEICELQMESWTLRSESRERILSLLSLRNVHDSDSDSSRLVTRVISVPCKAMRQGCSPMSQPTP
jgi:lambda repressor-like predicted transcriptional regulator